MTGAIDFPRQFGTIVGGEDFAFLFVGDAHAGVPDFDQAFSLLWADGDQNAAFLGVAQRILYQVNQRLSDEQLIAHHGNASLGAPCPQG
ncbi:hypothetical protein D3C72_1420710 [compost metagenome]